MYNLEFPLCLKPTDDESGFGKLFDNFTLACIHREIGLFFAGLADTDQTIAICNNPKCAILEGADGPNYAACPGPIPTVSNPEDAHPLTLMGNGAGLE